MQIGPKAEVGLLTLHPAEGDRAIENQARRALMIVERPRPYLLDRVLPHGPAGDSPATRYFHVAGDESGSYVNDNSIHDSFNRCLTIHGTHNVVAERNVAVDTIGHCYFFEDGIEHGNTLEGNLGLLTRAAQAGALLPTDQTPATFWISNPDNTIRNNVAAGSDGSGFWYDPPLHPTGLSKSATNDLQVWPRRTPLREFSGNLTHSDADYGLLVGAGTADSLLDYTPKLSAVPPASGADAPQIAVFQGLTTYKVSKGASFLMGQNLQLLESKSDGPRP